MSILSNTDIRSFDQRVTFQTKTQTQSSSGAMSITWADYAPAWARVDAAKASERFTAEQELAGNEYTVWIRWRGDINSNMRLVWHRVLNGVSTDIYMDIKGIPDNQRRGRFLSLFCEVGINQG